MLSTATALIQATEEALFDDEIMDFARFLTHSQDELSTDDFAKGIYLYSAALASLAIDKAMKVLLTESQVTELLASIGELEEMTNTILDEENN